MFIPHVGMGDLQGGSTPRGFGAMTVTRTDKFPVCREPKGENGSIS